MGEFHIDMKILKLEILYHHEVLKMLIRFPKISPIGNELDLNEGDCFTRAPISTMN